MLNVARKPRVGLLFIGTERFSALGEGTPHGSYHMRKEQDAGRMADDLKETAEVIYTGVIYRREDLRRAISAFTEKAVDCVLAAFLSWAEDFTWVRFLRDMWPVPILFAHIVPDTVPTADTHDDDAFTSFLCCGGLVGALEASGDNARFARPMLQTALGAWPDIQRRLGVFAAAARARALLRESTFGLLSSYNEVMWSTYVDPYDIFMKAGPELRFLSVAELRELVEETDEKEVRAVMERIAGEHPVLPDVDYKHFFASVRASIAMERQAERHGLDLLALNDVDSMLFRQIGLRPGFWPTRPDVRTLIVPEGDLGGGLAAYLLRLLTGGRVNYIEPFHIDLSNGCFAAGHAGPNDYTGPLGQTKVARDVRFARTNYRHAGAPFAWHVFPQGEMTMLHCSQRGERFQLVATLVDSLPCEHFLATYSHGLFRPKEHPAQVLFEKLLRTGVTQHYAIALGDHLEAVADTAELLDFDYVRV